MIKTKMFKIVLVNFYNRVFRSRIEHKTVTKWLYLQSNQVSVPRISQCSRINKSFPNGMDIGIYMVQVMGNPTVPTKRFCGALLRQPGPWGLKALESA
jgi:hypothetical protein